MEYSRQLYVIGKESMKFLENPQINVLIIGLDGLGNEIAKNIILCGVKNVSLYDLNKVTYEDISFYTSELDVIENKNRVDAVYKQLSKLNPQSNVHITTELSNKYSHMILVNQTLEYQIELNNYCRKNNIKFISCGTYNFFGQIFCDFGENFEITDIDGEDIKSGIIEDIKDNIITCVDEHNLSTNDKIQFNNNTSSNQIHTVFRKINKFKFSVINSISEATKFTQIKEKKYLSFVPLEESLNKSKSNDNDMKKYLEYLEKKTNKLIPMQSVIGGIVSQEILKAITHKLTPINQWFFFDANIIVPEQEEKMKDLFLNSRYNAQINIFGNKFQKKIEDTTIFVVGTGAIGCEHLKNFSLMGFNIVTTDMDTIEKSNLCRQFLFNNDDVNKYKSKVACEKIKKMNKNIKIYALQKKVCDETLDIFNEDFFKKINIIASALDNIDARLFLDKLCLTYKIPLIDSGTLGTKASTQSIIPDLTCLYGSTKDSVEKKIPACTLKHFPYLIEHTIQYARDLFEGYFILNDEKLEINNSGKKVFDQLYNEQINDLLKDETHEWNNTTKRKPIPIIYDEKNKSHNEFVTLFDKLYSGQINEFDKDNNDHIKFITLCSNLRAQNYLIDPIDEFTTKKIAGKIIPAIATTTALVSGLVALEIYKILLNTTTTINNQSYLNYYINLAVPIFASCEPVENKELWDRYEFKNPYINEIYDKIPNISCIMYEKNTIISEFMDENEQLNRKKQNLIDIYKKFVKKDKYNYPIMFSVITEDDKIYKCIVSG